MYRAIRFLSGLVYNDNINSTSCWLFKICVFLYVIEQWFLYWWYYVLDHSLSTLPSLSFKCFAKYIGMLMWWNVSGLISAIYFYYYFLHCWKMWPAYFLLHFCWISHFASSDFPPSVHPVYGVSGLTICSEATLSLTCSSGAFVGTRWRQNAVCLGRRVTCRPYCAWRARGTRWPIPEHWMVTSTCGRGWTSLGQSKERMLWVPLFQVPSVLF